MYEYIGNEKIIKISYIEPLKYGGADIILIYYIVQHKGIFFSNKIINTYEL